VSSGRACKTAPCRWLTVLGAALPQSSRGRYLASGAGFGSGTYSLPKQSRAVPDAAPSAAFRESPGGGSVFGAGRRNPIEPICADSGRFPACIAPQVIGSVKLLLDTTLSPELESGVDTDRLPGCVTNDPQRESASGHSCRCRDRDRVPIGGDLAGNPGRRLRKLVLTRHRLVTRARGIDAGQTRHRLGGF
jgi:hypothetical protein